MTAGQNDFALAVLDPDRPVPDGLIDPAAREAGRRFDVYRNNVVVSLSRALADGFPVIRKLLGEIRFSALAGHFVRRHPPETPVLALYGEQLPGFLETFEPLRELGYLADVARLELALRQSYHAADSGSVPPDALGTVAPERLMAARLRLAPSLRLVASRWPIVSIWRFNMEAGPKPRMAAETALVCRPDFDPVVHLLSPAGGQFVGALAEGRAFAEAVEAATRADDTFDLTGALGTLLAGGAITEIKGG